METLAVDIYSIEAVVVSHDHWDHTGGLWDLLKLRKGLKVYGCFGFSQNFKDKVKEEGGLFQESDAFMQITSNIYVTGEIAGRYKGNYIAEQGLVIKTKSGLVVIVGCSHPGIIRIIDKIREKFPNQKIEMVFGGFHMIDKDKREIKIIAEELKARGVEKLGPSHCTGYDAQAIFKKEYKDKFISIKAGQVFEV